MHPHSGRRREILAQHVDATKLHIVEIGALASPTFPPDKFSVRFIDYATREQIAKDMAGRQGVPLDKLVNVDYPLVEPTYSQRITERFDLAIANHVIEHVPDTIRWLDEIRAILVEGGHLFLSVPDRRYTFDYLKRETNIWTCCGPTMTGRQSRACRKLSRPSISAGR